MGTARLRRMSSGLNAAVSILLALIAVIMINYIASSYFRQWRIGITDFYKLSPKTKAVLATLSRDVTITVFFEQTHANVEHIENLLKEYRFCANNSGSRININFVDPVRDLVKARELAGEYGVTRPNTIVVESGKRRKFIEEEDIFEYALEMGRDQGLNLAAYHAERAITSAIQNVLQQSRPVIYFLAGHGERDVSDYSGHSGYSSIGRIMRRDNIEVRTLFLSESSSIPVDCSALVIAGPDRQYSEAETELIAEYLEKSGRLMCLIDPVVTTGLDSLLQRWQVNLCPEVAVGRTLTGQELVVNRYGTHPITRNLGKITTMFYMPRCVEPAPGAGTDNPIVTVLISNREEGWGETDLEQNPPRYNPGVDRPGPVPIAVAVERGLKGKVDVELPSTRLVVIGDSAFVSNGALRTGVGGNTDFFMSALNWLLERETIMQISARRPSRLQPDMTRVQWIKAQMILAGGFPGLVMLAGILVWLSRRK